MCLCSMKSPLEEYFNDQKGDSTDVKEDCGPYGYSKRTAAQALF